MYTENGGYSIQFIQLTDPKTTRLILFLKIIVRWQKMKNKKITLYELVLLKMLPNDILMSILKVTGPFRSPKMLFWSMI